LKAVGYKKSNKAREAAFMKEEVFEDKEKSKELLEL
jgi:hypothetical protein